MGGWVGEKTYLLGNEAHLMQDFLQGGLEDLVLNPIPKFHGIGDMYDQMRLGTGRRRRTSRGGGGGRGGGGRGGWSGDRLREAAADAQGGVIEPEGRGVGEYCGGSGWVGGWAGVGAVGGWMWWVGGCLGWIIQWIG